MKTAREAIEISTRVTAAQQSLDDIGDNPVSEIGESRADLIGTLRRIEAAQVGRGSF